MWYKDIQISYFSSFRCVLFPKDKRLNPVIACSCPLLHTPGRRSYILWAECVVRVQIFIVLFSSGGVSAQGINALLCLPMLHLVCLFLTPPSSPAASPSSLRFISSFFLLVVTDIRFMEIQTHPAFLSEFAQPHSIISCSTWRLLLARPSSSLFGETGF